jgi:hypothetical protein
MSLVFFRAYRMTDLHRRFLKDPAPFIIVMGARIVQHEGDPQRWFEARAGTARGVVSFPIELLEDNKDGTLMFRELDRKPAAEDLIVWVFEPYTFDMWIKEAKAGKIEGYEDLRDGIKTTDDLQNFLLAEYVDDGWIEESERMLGVSLRT